MYAMIALGDTLPLPQYEGLHEKVLPSTPLNVPRNDEQSSLSSSYSFQETIAVAGPYTLNDEIPDDEKDKEMCLLKEHAKGALMECTDYLLKCIDSGGTKHYEI